MSFAFKQGQRLVLAVRDRHGLPHVGETVGVAEVEMDEKLCREAEQGWVRRELPLVKRAAANKGTKLVSWCRVSYFGPGRSWP